MDSNKKKNPKTNRGGARPGAGNPGKDDPKVQIRFGVKKSKIDKIGSKEKVQEICLQAIEFAVDNLDVVTD